MKHPGHIYGGFVPVISEWGMTLPQMSTSVWRPRPRDGCGEYDRSLASLDDHPHMPKVRVLMKLPWDTDEKWGPTIPQCLKHGPQSPQKVSSIPTIIVGLRRHNISMWWHANVLPHYQLHSCHLEREEGESK
jgi:hypothetical protein